MTVTHATNDPDAPATPDAAARATPDDPWPAVRQATRADAAALTVLARAAKASWDYPAAWLTAWETELSFSEQYLDTHLVFAINQLSAGGALPVAAVCALERAGAGWVLAHLWVAPSAQRRGLGARLVRHALQAARERYPGIVIVDADPNAAEFYTRLGGVPSGLRTAPMPGAADRALPRFTFDVHD